MKAQRVDTALGVEPGDAFEARAARGARRRLVVEAITWETGVPRALLREVDVVLAPCADPAMHDLFGAERCDACPAPPSKTAGLVEVALTFALRRVPELPCWCLPAWYEPRS